LPTHAVDDADCCERMAVSDRWQDALRAPSSGEVIDIASWKVIAMPEDEARML